MVVATLCVRGAPQAARARRSAAGPYTHNQMRHNGLPVVLDMTLYYRPGNGRQVSFRDEADHRTARIVFLDGGMVVAETMLIPQEDLTPYAQHVVQFLADGARPNLAAR